MYIYIKECDMVYTNSLHIFLDSTTVNKSHNLFLFRLKVVKPQIDNPNAKKKTNK